MIELAEDYGDLRSNPGRRAQFMQDCVAFVKAVAERIPECESFRTNETVGTDGYAGRVQGYFVRPSDGYGVSLCIVHSPNESFQRHDGIYAFLQYRSVDERGGVGHRLLTNGRIPVRSLAFASIVNQVRELLKRKPTDEQLNGA